MTRNLYWQTPCIVATLALAVCLGPAADKARAQGAPVASNASASVAKGSPLVKPKDSKAAETAPKPKPVPAPAPKEIDDSIHRGIAFLLKDQNSNGSWGSERSARPDEVMAPIPGAHHAFRAAVTSLCVSALLEVGGDSPEVTQAIDRGEAWLFDHVKAVRRNSPECIYNNWSHAYSIQAMVRMLHRKPNDAERREKIRALIEHQIGMLGRYECIDGGWCYYDFEYHAQRPAGSTISFVTATVLVALAEARDAGVIAPHRMVDRATASILRQRKPDFSYDYGEYLKYRPMMPVNRPGGSLGRSQACNLAMRLWGDKQVTDNITKAWLDRLFARNLWLDIGRKRPVPHESWFQVAGYFFYYGHYYASRCIEQLPAADRDPYRDQLAHVLLRLQEKDGTWWDFPFYNYHREYGTAFALMSLGRCYHGHTAHASR